jgi:hypothetical protein
MDRQIAAFSSLETTQTGLAPPLRAYWVANPPRPPEAPQRSLRRPFQGEELAMALLEAQPPDLDPPVAAPDITPVRSRVLWPPLDFLAAGEPPSAPVAVSLGAKQTTSTSSRWDVVDEWGMDSFPASDPPANW